MSRLLDNIMDLEDIDIEARRVFVRVDLNTPLDRGEVSDDTRIRAALPTIEGIIERGGRPVLASHLGRPQGQRDERYSLEPVAARLASLLPSGEVFLADDCIGDGARKLASDMREGQVVLLENLRFHPGEKRNDEAFAKELAALADVYVNDAFGTMHREHASVVALARSVRERGAGKLVRRELAALNALVQSPERPYIAVLGGAKVSDKIGVIEALLNKVDALIIGGAMANTFLAAQGLRSWKEPRSRPTSSRLPVLLSNVHPSEELTLCCLRISSSQSRSMPTEGKS